MAAVSPIIQDISIFGAVLLATLAVSEVLRRLEQSEMIGHLLLGIFLGPAILDVIHPSEIFEFLAEIGAIMLPFIAGLETNVELLKKGRSKSSSARNARSFV